MTAPQFEPDDGWVPADQRFFGVDRRTIAPTLAVFALVFVMSVVLPVVNTLSPYRDIVKAGDVVQLAGNVSFVPEPGWSISRGVRAGSAPMSGAYPDTATVRNEAMKFTVNTAPFRGDADKLLDQIEVTSGALRSGRGVQVMSAHTPIVTAEGHRGALARVIGPNTSGVIAAFVFGDRGVQAVATGPPDIGPESMATVYRMIQSISPSGKATR